MGAPPTNALVTAPLSIGADVYTHHPRPYSRWCSPCRGKKECTVPRCSLTLRSSMRSSLGVVFTDTSFPVAFSSDFLPRLFGLIFRLRRWRSLSPPLALRYSYRCAPTASRSPTVAGRFQNLGGKPHYSPRCVNTGNKYIHLLFNSKLI